MTAKAYPTFFIDTKQVLPWRRHPLETLDEGQGEPIAERMEVTQHGLRNDVFLYYFLDSFICSHP